MTRKTLIGFSTVIIVILLLYPQVAFAYIGPGSGLSAIGVFLAMIVGVFAAILGFFWYPIKRLFGGKKKSSEPDQVKNKEE